MRRLAPILLFIGLGIVAFGQQIPENVTAQIWSRLELNENQMRRAQVIISETEKGIQEAEIELAIFKAQLAKILFPVDVNMREVQRVLQQSYEWQLKKQFAQITRQVELRKLFGEDKWANYVRIVRNLQQRNQTEGNRQQRPAQD